MNDSDDLRREIGALRRRLSLLSEASLRINESLELDVVLQDVLNSARSLTGARYGVMTLLEDGGRIQDFLSSGMTDDEAGLLWDTPDRMGMEIFEYLNSLSEPLRIPDLLGLLRQLGFPEFRPPMPVDGAVSFLAAPVFHRGERVGNVFVAGREEGSEFTDEDESTLVMFASQAALVIANAKRYREERRARAGLEALVETSPIGVVVFDAGTGRPTSFNREALRVVDHLRSPGQSPEELLDSLTIRRADGREVVLAELPLARLMSAGETVRAEEMTLLTPDGRSLTALVNASPVRAGEGEAEDGEVEFYVVTLQDLTELEELGRLRADFLAMVSHELRTPLATVKGSVTNLLDQSTALDPGEVRQFHRIIDHQIDRMRELTSDLLDVARIETGTLPVDPQPVDLAVLVDQARNAFANGGGRHTLTFDLPPDLPWVTADRMRIVQVLGNLLSNAARHSPETSAIRVSAAREGVQVAVSVADEGRGVSAEMMPHLFRRFAGTLRDGRGSGVGGSGLGLAICRGIVEAHGGRVWAESEGPGRGARFTFTLPLAEEPDSVAHRPGLLAAGSRTGNEVRILAVDDDPQALRLVRDALTRAGYSPVVTGDPEEALRLMSTEKPKLVLLDLLLPDVGGIELMQDIMGIADVPVIFLSVYAQDEVVAQALYAGADDYVVKPFSTTELTARIRAALRRRETPAPSGPYVLGELVVDFAQRRVTLVGEPVQLPATEYRMLAELASNAGRVLTYEHLLQRVWGPDNNGDLRPMRTVVNGLRRKLGDNADNPRYIFTEPRVGYRMAGEETPS